MRPSHLAVLLLVAACEAHPSSSGARSAGAEVVLRQDVLSRMELSVDLVAVFDDGPGMTRWRDDLADELAGGAASLAIGPAPDRISMRLDVGRVSANPATGATQPDGVMRGAGATGACTTAEQGTFVRSECLAGNFTPPGMAGLGAAVGCIGRQPAATTRSAPLAALREALVEPPRENLGFLHDDAYLLILMVSATDDESTDSSGQSLAVDEVVGAVKALKPSDMTLVSVLGPADAPRLRSFAERMGGVAGVLGRDPLLAAALQPLSVHIEPDCLRMPLRDADDAAPGLQPLCSIYERSAGVADLALSSCETAAPPCWTIQASPRCLESGLTIRVQRPPHACPRISSLHIECAACTSFDQPGCEERPR